MGLFIGGSASRRRAVEDAKRPFETSYHTVSRAGSIPATGTAERRFALDTSRMFDHLLWLIPAMVLAAGVWRPRAGLLVLAATLPFFGSPPGGPYLTSLDIAALAAIVTAWRAGPSVPSRVDRPVAVFVLISLASLVPLAYLPPSWRTGTLIDLVVSLPNVQTWSALYTWRAAINLVLGWLLFLTIKRAFHGRSLRPLATALAIGVTMVLVVGYASRGGILELWDYRPIGGRLWDPRLHSLFFHSGWLAEYLVLATPVAVAGLAAGDKRRRLAAAGLALAALFALAFTLQRGAWIAAGLQCLLAGFFLLRTVPLDRVHWKRLAAGAGTVLLIGFVATAVQPDVLAPIQERLADGSQLSGRWPVWQASATMATKRPLLGWGLGGFVPAFADHDDNVAGAVHWLTPHNQYLMLIVERGLLGLAAFALLSWAVARSLLVGLRHNDSQHVVARSLVVSLVGFLVYGLVQYFFFLKAIEWLLWILAGAAAALSPAGRARRTDVVAASLAAVALLVVPWRMARTAPIDSPTNRSFGFHRPEPSAGGAFEWTERRAGRRVPWDDETLVLEVANGHPMAAERPLAVTVRIDGRVRARATLHGGWEELRIVLGPPTRSWVVVGIEATPAFRPYREFRRYPQLERSRDIRQLGVAVRPFRWESGVDRTGSR